MERKISKSGGITIPSNLRMELGIQGKEKINIEKQDDGNILIRRIQGTCIFCSSVENVQVFKGKFICQNCKEVLTTYDSNTVGRVCKKTGGKR